MDTLIIQVTNQKALKLIHELEELHLIRVLKENTQPGKKLSEKYARKLPENIADDLQNYIVQSRNEEWNSSI